MAEASSPLTFRDSVRHLLPTAAAIALFAPFVSEEKLDVGGLVFASVILGYVITTPLTTFLGWLYRFTPTPKAAGARRQWINSNWNFDVLFYERLSQEEREYAYLTGSYVDFYRQLAFYLLLYAAVNLMVLAHAISVDANHAGAWQTILCTTTPLAGGFKLSTAFLIIVSVLLGGYCFWDFLNEYAILFLEEGTYVRFAEKSQKEKGGLTENVWGMAQHNGKGAPAVPVELLDSGGKALEAVHTDSNGLFQFRDRFQAIAAQGGKVQARYAGQIFETPLIAGANTVPFAAIDLPDFDPQTSRKLSTPFWIALFLWLAVFIQSLIVRDALSMIDLLASLPTITFLLLASKGPKEAFEDWRLSASLLAGVILAAVKLFWLVQNLVRVVSANTTVPDEGLTTVAGEWYRFVPPLLLVIAFFVVNRLKVENR